MTYEPLDQQAAEAAILTEVGRRDERAFVHIIARYHQDQNALSSETVFGHALNRS